MADDWWDPFNWFGSNSSTSAPQMTGYADAMTPGQQGVGGFTAPTSDTGPGTGSNLTTTVHPTTTQSFGDWLMSKEGAAALQKTGESLKGPDSGAKPPDPKVNQAQLGGGSQAVPGNANSITNLLQMLSQRRYSPIGYSGGGSSTRGLLGY